MSRELFEEWAKAKGLSKFDKYENQNRDYIWTETSDAYEAWKAGYETLAVERDALRAEVERLREALRGLLRNSDLLVCSTSHHAKRDQHGDSVPCPVETKSSQARIDAVAALSAGEKE